MDYGKLIEEDSARKDSAIATAEVSPTEIAEEIVARIFRGRFA